MNEYETHLEQAERHVRECTGWINMLNLIHDDLGRHVPPSRSALYEELKALLYRYHAEALERMELAQDKTASGPA